MVMDRIKKIMDFVVEIDKVKSIFRRNYNCDGTRKENDAEHSWHIAVMAMLLKEFFPKTTDISKTLQMLLIHDLVEIYAGDTYCYDAQANEGKEEREDEAARKLFAMLPMDLNREYYDLWREFEDEKTQEAHLANACDKLQPLLLNYTSEGKSWKEHGIDASQVMERIQGIKEYSPVVWTYFNEKILDAREKGFLRE